LSVDLYLLHAAQTLRLAHPWFASAMRDLSGLGSTSVLTVLTVAVTGYLWLIAQARQALLVAAAATSGTLLVSVFKDFFARLRPDTQLAELAVTGMSFPSGHASMSAIVFLMSAMLLAGHKRGAERGYILATAALLSLLVGLSRVALGVHWATDVVGGWVFGLAWALLWLQLARRMGAGSGSPFS
jgi:undecaprenyl-diphosphatase